MFYSINILPFAINKINCQTWSQKGMQLISSTSLLYRLEQKYRGNISPHSTHSHIFYTWSYTLRILTWGEPAPSCCCCSCCSYIWRTYCWKCCSCSCL